MASTEHRDGTPWYKAPIPRRLHRCRPQSWGQLSLMYVQRCACGAKRVPGSGSWVERNSRQSLTPEQQEEQRALAADLQQQRDQLARLPYDHNRADLIRRTDALLVELREAVRVELQETAGRS